MILIIPFANFAINFFLVRSFVSGMKEEHSWYVVFGMVVVDLGKAAFAVTALDPISIFLFTIGGLVGSVVGRNEGVKNKGKDDDANT